MIKDTIYRIKLVSLNPDRYELQPANKLVRNYSKYRDNYMDSRYKLDIKDIKSFTEWRLTEI